MTSHAAHHPLDSEQPDPSQISPLAAHRDPLRIDRVPVVASARSLDRLMEVIQELSLARTLVTVMDIVQRAAPRLTGADGAALVLRDGDCCYYAEEDAMQPFLRGRRFPMTESIGGWAMLHRQPAVIEDIYADPRVHADRNRPTFVKSLAVVPIRTAEPIGAIGNYWSRRHRPTLEEVRVLQALADSTSIAIENVRVYAELEKRVRERTAALETANQELEAFSSSVSHDLRAPLTLIGGFSEVLARDYADRLDAAGRSYLRDIEGGVQQMSALIQDLLELSRSGRAELRREEFDVSALAASVVEELRRLHGGRTVAASIEAGLHARGDESLVRIVLENLLGNAWKFTSKVPDARVEVGTMRRDGGDAAAAGEPIFFVRDNGAGFDAARAERLFQPFQRLHTVREFPGTGIGLATVRRVILRHGGRVWAESAVGKGTSVYFTLPWGGRQDGRLAPRPPLAG
jgi:signal transduction histidine kinase